MEQCAINISSDEHQYRYTAVSWSFQVVFAPLVTILGILSNFSFIFTVYRVKFMRNVTNIYLVNLAIADSSLLVAAFSQYIGDYINTPDYNLPFSFYTAFGCAFTSFLVYLSYYASMWTISLVAIERYVAVSRQSRPTSSKKRAIGLVVIAWILSIFFAGFTLPLRPVPVCVFSAEENTLIDVFPTCISYCKWCDDTLFSTDIVQFVIALCINIVMYILIIKNVSASSAFQTEDEDFPEESRGESVLLNQARNKVARMLIINGMVFFVCLAPFTFVNIHYLSNYLGDSSKLLAWAGRVMFLINSAVNPLIYNVTNPRYRLAFKRAFGIHAKPKNTIYNTTLASQDSHQSQTTRM